MKIKTIEMHINMIMKKIIYVHKVRGQQTLCESKHVNTMPVEIFSAKFRITLKLKMAVHNKTYIFLHYDWCWFPMTLSRFPAIVFWLIIRNLCFDYK